MDDGLCHDSIQHGTRNRNFYKSHLFYCTEKYVNWIYYHRITCLFRIRPSGKNVCFPRRAAGRPTNLYYFCNPDLHGYLAGCIRQCDQCISRGHGFTANFIPDYLTTYCKNFILAFPLQLIFVGPLARFIFRMLFISRKKEKNMAEIQNDDEQILDEVM